MVVSPHHEQQFFSAVDAFFTTRLTLIAARVGLTALGIFTTLDADAGVIKRAVVALNSFHDAIDCH